MKNQRPLMLLGCMAALMTYSISSEASELTLRRKEIAISGEITREMVETAIPYLYKISAAREKRIAETGVNEFPVSVCVNSQGGDLEAAMDLGRTLRRIRANVTLCTRLSEEEYSSAPLARVSKAELDEIEAVVNASIDGAVCASSCVFVLMGATTRQSFPVLEGHYPAVKIGVHRPMSTKISTTAEESAKEYARVNQLVRDYLQEMNIPGSFLDMMNAVAPGEIRWLTHDESRHFLPTTDPVEEDLQRSARAKSLGISKEEVLQREIKFRAELEQWLKENDEKGK